MDQSGKKRVIIGDVHCNGNWRRIVEKHADADEFIFVGDYLDPYSKFEKYEDDCIFGVKNFMRIVEFKRSKPEKVTLLLGNHDFHYLKAADGEFCSRYSDFFWNKCNPIFEDLVAKDEIQIAKQFENVLVSHAGVSPAWFGESLCEDMVDLSLDAIAAKVNNHFKTNPFDFGFDMVDGSGYGDHPLQSPLWIRPHSMIDEMEKFKYRGKIVQVVGHTSVKKIRKIGQRHSLWLVDTQKSGYDELVFKGKIPQ